MKKLLFLLLFAPLAVFSQNGLTMTPDEVSYEKVIETPDLDKDQLFGNAREWYMVQFVNSKSVIHYEDKESGKIAGKGYTDFITTGDVFLGTSTELNFVLKTYFKDGKTKMVLENMTVHMVDEGSLSKGVRIEEKFFKKNGQPRAGNKNMQKKLLQSIAAIFDSYKEYMTSEKAKDADDW